MNGRERLGLFDGPENGSDDGRRRPVRIRGLVKYRCPVETVKVRFGFPMPVVLNWLSNLVPTNPIAVRIVSGGSKRSRHLLLRSGYLAIMIAILLLGLLGGDGSMKQLATRGAGAFSVVSFGQVALICILTPIFMAGAIVQEASPRTWDILLTTPLSNLQIVLGNLFGRLFFILALLFSTLPLFVLTQFFGGVPGESIFTSYAIAASSALIVATTAVTLSVTRSAGKRAVVVFYAAVVMYLFVTYAADAYLRTKVGIGVGTNATQTTFLTAFNPFLALESALNSTSYVPYTRSSAPFTPLWFVYTAPATTFCLICVASSLAMILWSMLRLRVIGTRGPRVSWWRVILGTGAGAGGTRASRRVGANPIAWRENMLRSQSIGGMFGRWIFLALGACVGIVLCGLHRQGTIGSDELRLALLGVVGAEIAVVLLTAVSLSATAVSREREDGTLDILLTTPIQPGPYLAGKLRGIVQFLVPMILVPFVTLGSVSIYVLAGGFGAAQGVTVIEQLGFATVTLPVILPEGAVLVLIDLIAATSFAIMIGLQWSLRTKGTIGSVMAAVGVLGVIGLVLGGCAAAIGNGVPYVGAAAAAASPLNMLFATVDPASSIAQSLSDVRAARSSLFVGVLVACVAYGAACFAMHGAMKKSFMMVVRRLAGTN
jgi:ABC-type transport system involved in multi-copper enzyme maturation permease subunit